MAVTNVTFDCIDVSVFQASDVDRTDVRITFGFFYSLIWIVGMVGNIGVLYCLKHHVSFLVRDTFIWNLTLADFGILSTSLPMTSIASFTRTWPLAIKATCKAVPFIQAVSIFVTSLTLCLIAYDRYHSVRKPHKPWLQYPWNIVAVVAIWFLACGIAAPYLSVLTLTHVPINSTSLLCGQFCIEDWGFFSEWAVVAQKTYGVLLFAVQFVIPLCINTICYSALQRRVMKSINQRLAGTNVVNENQRRILHARRRKINRMILLMLISFFLPWLPLNIMNLVRDFYLDNEGTSANANVFTILFLAAHVIAMTACTWDPIIYTLCNSEFTDALFKKLPCRRRPRRPVEENAELQQHLNPTEEVRKNGEDTVSHVEVNHNHDAQDL